MENKQFDFGQAMFCLKNGDCVRRTGWNGKDMYLVYVPAEEYTVEGVGKGIPLLPWIGMKTADNKFVPWLASQTDILAVDWELV